LKETSIDYWTISIKDNTNGSSFTTNVEYDSSENSAEWIEEDPSSVDSQIPFDDFGSVTFSNASAIENGSSVNLSTSKAQALNMVDEYDQELASTSALTSDDKGFTVTRSDSEPEQVVQEYEGYTGGFSRHGEGIGQSYGYSPYGDGFGGYYENDGFGNGYGRF
jgi:hypothetical protein